MIKRSKNFIKEIFGSNLDLEQSTRNIKTALNLENSNQKKPNNNISFYIFYHDQTLLNNVTQTLNDKRFNFINLNELKLPKELIIPNLTVEKNKAIFSEYLGLLLVKPETDLVGFFTYSIAKKFSVEWAKETGEFDLFLPEIRFDDFNKISFKYEYLYCPELNNPKSKFPNEIEDIHKKFRVGNEIINKIGPYKGSFIVNKKNFLAFQQWFHPVVKYILQKYTLDHWGLENSLYTQSKHAEKDNSKYQELDKLRHGIGELLERCVTYYFAQTYNDNAKIKLNEYIHKQNVKKNYKKFLRNQSTVTKKNIILINNNSDVSLLLNQIGTLNIHNILFMTNDKRIYAHLKVTGYDIQYEEQQQYYKKHIIPLNDFMKILHKKQTNKILIIVFANYNYLPVLENWIEAVKRIGVNEFLIISLDKQLHLHLQKKNINSLLRPCELDLGKLWIHRIEVLLEMMKQGYDIIHSDADAIWLKDPLPYLNDLPQDMIFSQGTIWPPDVQGKWGFVLCCGFFLLRSNQKTLQFMRDLLKRVNEDRDDQVSCNRLLLEMGADWNSPDNPYTIDFREKQFICSETVRYGKYGKLTLALLPHKKFQRIFEKTDDVYIRHLISEKNSENIVDVLKNTGCWFIE